MSWKPPESEVAWDEALSAYLDGELSDQERRGVEKALEKDARLSARLETYRSLSGLLRESRVEAAEPDGAFVREWKGVYEEGRRPVPARRPMAHVRPVWFRALSYAAILCIGIFLGAFADDLAKDRQIAAPKETPTPSSPMTIRVVSATPAISPRQAANLIRENEAENLKNEVLKNIKRSEWKGAWAAGWKLGKEYSDTLNMDDLDGMDRDGVVRYIRRQYSRYGRM